MNKVKIYYGSKKWFDKNRPSTYRNLTEVVNELDEQKRKNIMFIANMPKNNESDKMVDISPRNHLLTFLLQMKANIVVFKSMLS